MADNCPCSPSIAGVPAGAAVPRQHACSLPARPGGGHGHRPDPAPAPTPQGPKEGPRGVEDRWSQQEQLWGTASEIWGRKLDISWRGSLLLRAQEKGPWHCLISVPWPRAGRAVAEDGGDKRLRGQTEECGLRHAPPVLACRHRHQPTEIKEKPLRPNLPHRVRGITSLVPVLQLTRLVLALLGCDPGVPLYEASQCSKSRVIALTCR